MQRTLRAQLPASQLPRGGHFFAGRATWKWVSGRPSLPTLFPIILKAAIEMRAAQCQDRVGSPDSPEHSRLFETRADDRLAAGFDHPRANKQVLTTKFGIPHALCISFEVIGLSTNLLGDGGMAAGDRPQHARQFFDFAFVQ